jgi:hypothetical protein
MVISGDIILVVAVEGPSGGRQPCSRTKFKSYSLRSEQGQDAGSILTRDNSQED